MAESCTGGLVAEKLTDVPGSSAYFLGGVVAYADAAKRALLGVPEALLAEHGAVSEPVARAMAEGVRERFGADLAIATTGISGPDGGSEAKPVGLVYLALADAQGTHSDHFVFPLDRTRHRQITAQVALDWIRRRLLGVALEGPTLCAGGREGERGRRPTRRPQASEGGPLHGRESARSGRSSSAPPRAGAPLQSPRRCASSPMAAGALGARGVAAHDAALPRSDRSGARRRARGGGARSRAERAPFAALGSPASSCFPRGGGRAWWR